MPSATLARLLPGHTNGVYAAAVDSGLVATGGDDRTVRIFGVTHGVGRATGTVLEVLHPHHKVWALSLRAGLLASAGQTTHSHSTIDVWDVRGLLHGGDLDRIGTACTPVLARLQGGGACCHSLVLRGADLTAAGEDGVVRVWRIPS